MFRSLPEILYGLPRMTGTSTSLYSTKPCGWVTPFNIRWSIPTNYERTVPPYRITLSHHPHSVLTNQMDPSYHLQRWVLSFIVLHELQLLTNYLHCHTSSSPPPLLGIHTMSSSRRIAWRGENNIHR